MTTINQVFKKEARKKKKHKTRSPALKKNPQKKGICLKVYTTSPKKPNSAVRKVVKVRLSNSKKIIAYVPGQGHSLQKFANVLIRGGRVRDLPGVRYKLIRGHFDFTSKESFKRRNARSKYSIQKTKDLSE